jgi:hypothetical protein
LTPGMCSTISGMPQDRVVCSMAIAMSVVCLGED